MGFRSEKLNLINRLTLRQALRSSSFLLGLMVAAPSFAQILSQPKAAQDIDLMDATFYGEAQKALQLYTKTTNEKGEVLMLPSFNVPAQAIVAIETEKMADAIKLQKTSPEQVNYLYFNSVSSETKLSKNGWVCDVKVIDVLEEEIRSSEAMEKDNYCLSIVNLTALNILEGNGEQVKLAAAEALKSQKSNTESQDQRLQSLAAQMAEIRIEQKRLEDSGETEIAGPLAMISPLKDCGKGCLVKTSNFGMRRHPVLGYYRLHKGVDIRAKVGTVVTSVHEGRVLANRAERGPRGYKGYGLYTIVAHPGARMNTLYAHLSAQLVRPGQKVKQGQSIARSGATGLGSGPHLHFEVHPIVKGIEKVVNPLPYIKHLL